MSNTCLLMVLCKCACANLVSKANFNLINRTDFFICLHIMFQISFQNSKEQNSYCKFLGVRLELLLSIHLGVKKFFIWPSMKNVLFFASEEHKNMIYGLVKK